MKFSIKDFFSKCDPTAVTFTEEILNRKFQFLCNAIICYRVEVYLEPHQISMVAKRCCPAGNYLLKVNKINTKTRCEICSKLTNSYLLNE